MSSRPKLEVIQGGIESLFDPFNDAYLEYQTRLALGLPPLDLVETEEERKTA